MNVNHASGTGKDNVSIFAGNMTGSFLRMQNQKEENLGLFGKPEETESGVEAKKAAVRKKVSKVLQDRFSQDSENYYDVINNNRNKIEQAKETTAEMNGNIMQIRDSQKAMREELGITEDSQEHLDLKILRKMAEGSDDRLMAIKEGFEKIAAMFRKGDGHREQWGALTDEEWERAVQLSDQPITPYQAKCVTDDAMEEHYNNFIKEAHKEILVASGVIAGIKRTMLEQHGMADTLADIEEIEKAGSRDIIGTLTEEAMEHVKEEQEEEVEKAKEAAEEKEEQEEKTEESKAEKTPQEKQMQEMVGEIADQKSDMDQIQTKINKILEEAKLLLEDQKGILVDESL